MYVLSFRVRDVTANYTKAVGKHGSKETSTEQYSSALQKKFMATFGNPKWADLDRAPKDSDSDDELFRVSEV